MLVVLFHGYYKWETFKLAASIDLHFQGSVAERSKALVLGTSLNEAWVRIPPLPYILKV
jgi:hypothetical protein